MQKSKYQQNQDPPPGTRVLVTVGSQGKALASTGIKNVRAHLNHHGKTTYTGTVTKAPFSHPFGYIPIIPDGWLETFPNRYVSEDSYRVKIIPHDHPIISVTITDNSGKKIKFEQRKNNG